MTNWSDFRMSPSPPGINPQHFWQNKADHTFGRSFFFFGGELIPPLEAVDFREEVVAVAVAGPPSIAQESAG